MLLSDYGSKRGQRLFIEIMERTLNGTSLTSACSLLLKRVRVGFGVVLQFRGVVRTLGRASSFHTRRSSEGSKTPMQTSSQVRQLANKSVFLSQCSYPVTAIFRRRLRWVGRIDAGLRKRTAKLVGTRPSLSKRCTAPSSLCP